MTFDCCGGNDAHPKEHTMDCHRPFRVMQLPRHSVESDEQVKTVPWFFILQAGGAFADRSDRVQKNHSQTLEQLNARGGLSPMEIYAIYHDKGFGRNGIDRFLVTEAFALKWLKEELKRVEELDL